LRAGVAFGFVQTETLAAGESAATNTYAAAAYGTWTPGAWVIDGRFAIGPSATDSRRFVTLLGVPTPVTGSYSGLGYLVSADVGYRTEWQAITVKPYVGLTVQGLDQGDFIETSAVGLSFPSQTFTKVTSELGVRATSEFELAGLTLEPDLKAAWAHELSDNSLVTHAALFGAPFEIHAAEPGEDAFLVDGGVSVLLSDRLAAFVGYAGEFRSNATSQEVRGGLRLDL
jgi:outer membrane autotransporter protein